MTQAKPNPRNVATSRPLAVLLFLSALVLGAPSLRAQAAPQGPLAPPPDHHVVRIGNEPEPPAPPSLPESEIIQRFSRKEDEYLATRLHFTYKKTIRIEEFGPDGNPSGEYVLVMEPARDEDGKLYEKVVQRPQSTMKHFFLQSEDLAGLERIPAFPLTTKQLANYDLKYLGKEQVDEVNCYIFQVKPKVVERQKAFFDGVVWVDSQYLEVVKSYGQWMTDLGPMHAIKDMPFSLFETYRENVGGKYWFPSYSRSDDTADLKGQQIAVRIVIKWTDFKPLPLTPQATSTANPLPPARP